jgi:hypothetical protein
VRLADVGLRTQRDVGDDDRAEHVVGPVEVAAHDLRAADDDLAALAWRTELPLWSTTRTF